MSGYGIFSQYYDSLMDNVDYKKRAEYFRTLLMRYGVKDGAEIVDLGCGTGKLTSELAEMGYDMTGVDISPDMLCEARNNASDKGLDILLLCQSMDELDLYGTVDAAISTFDSINHLESAESVKETFKKVGLFMNPGGIFIFDINTPSKLKGLDGEVFLDETEDVFCVWRAAFDEKDNACRYDMDIFARDGKKWTRSREEHIEYAYEPQSLEKMLITEGFEDVCVYGDMAFQKPSEHDTRVFFKARKQK